MMKTDKWTNCYEDSWKDIIQPEAFSHPAKMAYGLLERIYQHARQQGWLHDGGKIEVTNEILQRIQIEVDNKQYQRIKGVRNGTETQGYD